MRSNISENDLGDLSVLLQQLSPGEKTISREELYAVLTDPNAHFVVERDETGRVIAMVALFVLHTFGGFQGIVEQIVVHEAHRRKGLGEKIMNKLIEIAKQERCCEIDLTSRPHRTAAHALYEKLGFQKRDTNVYRLKL